MDRRDGDNGDVRNPPSRQADAPHRTDDRRVPKRLVVSYGDPVLVSRHLPRILAARRKDGSHPS